MIDSPDVRLKQLAELFEQRNKLYGSTYKKHGPIVMAIFGGSIPEIRADIDSSRMAIINVVASKLSRYAENWQTGHVDSLNDISVYCQMLRELDDIKNRIDEDD